MGHSVVNWCEFWKKIRWDLFVVDDFCVYWLCDENFVSLHLTIKQYFDRIILHWVDDCEDLFETARGRHITSDLTN